MPNLLWTDKEIDYLKNNFSDLTNQELSDELNKPIKAITMKAFRLKLKKSKKHISKQIGKRNKMVGRDWSYGLLVDIASKYKTRADFQRNDSTAYSAANRNGWLNDICSHMIKTSYSIPQIILGEIMKNLFGKENVLTNDRQTLKPYELDVYIPKHRLAFEYDGKRWHLNNKNDIIKNRRCIEDNIKLIRIIENNRKYESDVKNQVINNLDTINKQCNTNFTKGDIINSSVKGGFENILDDKKIKNTISKYSDYNEWKSENPKVYSKLVRMKRLDDFTKDLERKTIKWDEEKIDKEISKYEYLDDFIKKSMKTYQHIMKNKSKFGYKLNKLKRKRIDWDINKIKKLVREKNYKTTYQIRRDYPGVFGYLKRNDLIEEIRSFMKELKS
jgi:hypothetical protein